MKWIWAIVILLAAIRLALPYAIKSYVNRSLNRAQDYTGKIGYVSMSLWRGGYQIEQIKILRKTGKTAVPLFSATQLDLSVEWRELFHGAVVGQVAMQDPHLNFASGTNAEENGSNEAWGKILQGLFPFSLNRLDIMNGEIHFENPAANPPVDIYLSQISAVATNLTNARQMDQALPSGLTAFGSTIGGGVAALQMKMNLLEDTPTYQLDCGITNVDLVSLNTFLRAYGKFDVARGDFSLFTSVAADHGNYRGYLKVFFKNLDVFAWDKERKKNILKVFWQGIVAGVGEILKNHVKDQLATKIPISGSYTNSSVGLWTATGTLLENAFIRALVPKLDQPVTIEQVDKSAGN